MDKSGADAEDYAKEVVLADFEKPGDDDVVQKLVKDLAAKSRGTTRMPLIVDGNRQAACCPNRTAK